MAATPEHLSSRRFGHPPVNKESEFWKQRVQQELAHEPFPPPGKDIPSAPTEFHAASEAAIQKVGADSLRSHFPGQELSKPRTPDLRFSHRQNSLPQTQNSFLQGLLAGDPPAQTPYVAYPNPDVYKQPLSASVPDKSSAGRLSSSMRSFVTSRHEKMVNSNRTEQVDQYRHKVAHPSHGLPAFDKIHSKGAPDLSDATIGCAMPFQKKYNEYSEIPEQVGGTWRYKDQTLIPRQFRNGDKMGKRIGYTEPGRRCHSSLFTLDHELENKVIRD
ncbi:hypothetical protein CYMTET_42234 [Cymbomonas tetramitiformis]|uniref:Uncharacterized protein n=1 Tax=Cymbomonas tetramitiformis TaxID=36881 RepID=A0AAE0C5U8_9CHLO|nr:hypothetical protein CYMTET_42234 [Cymbomonas tetramitiformis]